MKKDHSLLPTLILKEWKTTEITSEEYFLTQDDQIYLRGLGEDRVEIIELKEGLKVRTYSYVGIIRLENFNIIIQPKMKWDDMVTFLAYAMDLDTADFLSRDAAWPLSEGYIIELLSYLLLKEVKKLFSKGLLKRYVTKEEPLGVIKGRIDFNQLAKSPHLFNKLPCRYSEHSFDVVENRIITSSLNLAEQYVSNGKLKHEIKSMREFLNCYVKNINLTEDVFENAYKNASRLNTHYSPAINICYLIFNSLGPDPNILGGTSNGIDSFLINMNSLFERFLFRLLKEVAPPSVSISNSTSDFSLYSGSYFHHIRPDLVAISSDNTPYMIWDAKYKPYDRSSLSSSDLYQLTVYALALGSPWKAVILFPQSSEEDKTLEFTTPEAITVKPPGLNISMEIKLIGVPMTGLLSLLKSYDRIPEKELEYLQKQLEINI